MYRNNKIIKYFQDKNFDIRTSHNGRWMDQKVTPDVLSMVAETILDYSQNISKSFTNKDLYQNSDFLENVSNFFGKPAVAINEMENEYNKFVGQSIKALSYSEILTENTSKRPYLYTINNIDILELIAQSDRNALFFLQNYIKKCLLDSGFDNVNVFLNKKNKTQNDFNKLKNDFIEFEITNTNIKKELEPRRILAKVLNPLAFEKKTYGASHGHLSKEPIRANQLTYDSNNSQDSNKAKNISRKEFRATFENQYTIKYHINKTIKAVRNYNNKFNNGLSETGSKEIATQGHHMLPKSANYFPEFATYCENIIMLSPNEHFQKAHPNNNTHLINEKYQKDLLRFKKTTILNAISQHPDESPYNSEVFDA